ncbi:hypothetical protein C8F04DRAFT_1173008 [Mycena alexandri]|uniref:Uncharacterized protein n=1 Tax=Mycena alexandri TaxID=1745969 RepID=A0AAD6TG81_9AGAR|nr:hypothetical protein C8F04DRAFT_1173008 [Mycena alexandri]
MHFSPPLVFSILTALSGVLADNKFVLPDGSISFITIRTVNITVPGPGKANMEGKLKPYPNGDVKTNTNSTPHTLSPEDGNDTWFIAKQPNGSYNLTCSLNGMPQVLIFDLTLLLKGTTVRTNAVHTPSLPDATNWDIDLVSFDQIPPGGTFDLIFTVCVSGTNGCLTMGPGSDGSVSIQPKVDGTDGIPKSQEWIFDFIPIPIAGGGPAAAAAAAATVAKEGAADDQDIANDEVKAVTGAVNAVAGAALGGAKSVAGGVVEVAQGLDLS